MEKIVVASTNKGAGKTSIITGIMKALNLKFGYMKPFGDRLIYSDKKIWDLDAGYITETFNLPEKAEDLVLGFDHSKVKYLYNEKTVKKKLSDLAEKTCKGKKLLIIEGGSELWHGASVHLDSISIAKNLEAKLVLIVDGEDYDILDDIYFIKRHLDVRHIKLAGVVINKVRDVDVFRKTYVKDINREDVKVLGVVPYTRDLLYFKPQHLLNHLIAKNLTGYAGMNKTIKNIFVGDMSAEQAHRSPYFKKEDKLVITSGDRSDIILASIESNTTSCILLTNNITPNPNLIMKAVDRGIPMFLVSMDTYTTASHIQHLEPLLTKDDKEKTNLLRKLIQKNVEIDELIRQ